MINGRFQQLTIIGVSLATSNDNKTSKRRE
jgi:hypothetical protein